MREALICDLDTGDLAVAFILNGESVFGYQWTRIETETETLFKPVLPEQWEYIGDLN